MHKTFLFLLNILCLFSLIYIATPETKAERQDKGKSRILELIESEESAILEKKAPVIFLSVQEISEIVVPVLIYTNDKNDTKSILDSESIEKYEVFEHIDFVYAHINKSTLDALDLNSNTIFLYENEIFNAPEPVFSTETIQPTTTLSSTYTGKGNVVAVIDTGITDHPFITDSDVTALDGSSVPRIVYQECHSYKSKTTINTVVYKTWSLCEDTDGDGEGEGAVIDQTLNPAMNCDTLITSDCSHGLNIASAISGEKPAGETESTPNPSAPDAQLAIYKVSHGFVCNDENTDSTDGCVDGVEFLSISTSAIVNSINSIIGKKKEYLNGDTDGDAGLNIVSVNMSIGTSASFSSTECSGNSSPVKNLLYSNDSTKETLHNHNVAIVTSAGNAFQRNAEPLFGCLPGALSVAALDSDVDNPEVAYFSNIAPFTDFIDNGQDIPVAVIGGGYGEASGTSLSPPKISGFYSSLAQKYPDATVDELTKRLKTFATFFADTRGEYTHDGVTYPAAVNTTAKFPQPNIEEALSGSPIISRSKIKDISTVYDEASNTYSTIEDSLDIEFVSDTSRAYITSASGGHFTGEIDATAATDPINGVSVFSVTVPITDGITDTIFINTVDDLTTNDDIISTNLFIIEETTPTVFVEAVDTNTQTGDFDINVTFSKEVNNVDIGDFRLVLKDADTAAATTLGTIIVVELHSDSNFNDTSPSTTTDSTPLSGKYFKVKVTPQDDLLTDIGVTDYAFQVIDDTANSSSIVDGDGNSLVAHGFSGIIRATTDISIDTFQPKTKSISLVTSGTQTSTFDVKVSFTETVNNISVDNFDFTDGSISVASITKVEMHSDSDFNDQSPSSTSDSTTLSGRYFKISINTDNDINGTYTFKVLSISITDDNGNTFQTSTDDTLDVVVDTTVPVFTIAISPATSVLSQSKTVTLTNTNIEASVVYSYFLTTDSDSTTCESSNDSLFVNTISGSTFTLDEETQNNNYICIRAVDQAGNTTKQLSIKIENIDTTAPVFTTDISPATSVSSQSKTVTFTLTNTESSVAYSYFLTTDSDSATCAATDDTDFVNTLTTNTFTLDEETNNDNYICIRAVDQAGNETKQLSIKIENIDITSPTISGTKRDGDYQITISTNETLVGVTETDVSTNAGGFTITNSDGTTTLRPKTIEITSNTIILKFDDTSTTVLTDDGTYIYTPYTTTVIAITDDAGNDLASFDSTNPAEFISFTLDTDESGSYIASQDGLFLYLYTQTAKPLADSALELFIDSSSSLEDTKGNIDKGVTTNFLDLDESGSYVASQDGLFLYLYTQTAKPLADSALELFIDSNSSLEGTKDNIAKFLP